MPDPLPTYAAVVLAGGRATRLDGIDKAGVEVAGRTLLARALDAVADAVEVVVVGEQVPTAVPATFVVEDPRHGGPVAALLTGRDALRCSPAYVAVLAVDMPHLTPGTLARLRDAAAGRDGAALTDPDGRRQLAVVLDRTRLDAVAPAAEDRHGHPVHRMLARLDLVDVAPLGEEHRDVDTWSDLRDLAGEPGPDRTP